MLSIHISLEKKEKIKILDVEMKEDRICLQFGRDTVIVANNEQLEDLFDELDTKLHKVTYVQLQDKALGLEVENEELNDTITYLREIARGE